MTESATLEVRDVTVFFGGLRALSHVSLAAEGGVYGIVGPNGAGKTTLFNVISGAVRPTAGEVSMDGHVITELAPHSRARLGLGRTFQITNLFEGMTVLENVLLGTLGSTGRIRGWWSAALDHGRSVQRARDLLARFELEGLADRHVAELGYGEKRRLEIAVALGTEPSVLLLDEPTAGLSQAETTDVRDLIAGIAEALTVVLIEHDLDVIFDVADRVAVFDNGSVLKEGTAAEIRVDPVVQEVYLG
jgi:branched-chain amino acid transport system ATP-binding protein